MRFIRHASVGVITAGLLLGGACGDNGTDNAPTAVVPGAAAEEPSVTPDARGGLAELNRPNAVVEDNANVDRTDPCDSAYSC